MNTYTLRNQNNFIAAMVKVLVVSGKNKLATAFTEANS